MKHLVITALIGLSVVLHFSVVYSESESFTLEVRVLSYQNPLSVAYRGGSVADCCESVNIEDPPNCSRRCDNFFVVCLREYGDSSRPGNTADNSNCESEIAITGLLAMDQDDFTFSIGTPFPTDTTIPAGPFNEVSNPIVLESQNQWTGRIQLAFRAIDIDMNGTEFDEVDTLLQDFDFGDLSPAVDFTDPMSYTSANGAFGVRLSFRLTLNCTENFTGLDCTTCNCGTDCVGNFVCSGGVLECTDDYYGSNCGIFCEGRDDNTGHYNCSASGSRICLEGYQNPSTNCVDCVPAPGCSPAGGFCDSPGDCICRDGYEGNNCETLSMPTDSTSLPVGVIIGPVVGGVAVILIALIIIVLVAICILRKRQGKAQILGQPAESPRDEQEMNNDAHYYTVVPATSTGKGREAAAETFGAKANTVNGSTTREDLLWDNPVYDPASQSNGLKPNASTMDSEQHELENPLYDIDVPVDRLYAELKTSKAGPDPKTSTMDSEQHELENPLYDVGDVPGDRLYAEPKPRPTGPDAKTSTMDSEQHELENPLYDVGNEVPGDRTYDEPMQKTPEPAAKQTSQQQPIGTYSLASAPSDESPKSDWKPPVYDYADPSAPVRAVVTSTPVAQLQPAASSEQQPDFNPSLHYEFSPTADHN